MASTTVSPAQMEIADSLEQSDIPIKFRCAICGRLALNAVRLPCCDQNICDKCQSTLPVSCPICAHSPLSPDLAKPLKTLRLTVISFVKNIEKKREKERIAAEASSSAQVVDASPFLATPVINTVPDPGADAVAADPRVGYTTPQDSFDDNLDTVTPGMPELVEAEANAGADARISIEHMTVEQSIEEVPPYQHDTKPAVRSPPHHSSSPTNVPKQGSGEIGTEAAAEDKDEDDSRSTADSDEIEIVTGDEIRYDENGNRIYEEDDEAQYDENGWSQDPNHMQAQSFNNWGPHAAPNGFPNMGWNGAMNPAQMQLFQQQMQNNNWGGNANMMGGMSGMPSFMEMQNFMMQQMQMPGMDPTMMATMMSTMNSMNGMSGMNNGVMGGFGAGFDNAWNNGQMGGGGGYGANGYPSAGGGYGQSMHQGGNMPQMMSHHNQQYPKNNINQNNRFHGGPQNQRGGGRGYHNQGNGSFHQQQHLNIQPSGPPPGAPKGPRAAQQGYQVLNANDAFHHQLPQKVQSRRASNVVSLERQQHEINQNGDIAVQGENTTTVNPVPDNLEAPNLSDQDVAIEGNTGTTDYELTKQSQVESARGLEGLAEARTDPNEQQQLDPNSTSTLVDATHTNGIVDDGNAAMENGVSNSTPKSYNNQPHELPHHPQPNLFPSRGAFRGRGGFDTRGGFRGGRGGSNWQHHGTHGPAPEEAVTPVIPDPKGAGVQGAPKGPKAMRDGLPNTGWSGRGGRGGFVNGTRGGGNVPQSPISASHGNDGTPKQAERIESERSRAKSRSRSRSRTSRDHRSRNNRSRTPSSESEHDRKRDSRRHRSSRYYEEVNTDTAQPDDQDYDERSRDKDRHRSSRSHRDSSRRRHRRHSRSRSPARADDNAVREEKRGEKYRDKSRDREREERDRDRRERDKKRSSRRDRSESRDSDRHGHRSSRHSKKDKERERDRDHERDRERERERGSRGDRDRGDREHTASGRTLEIHTPIEASQEVGFKIHGQSKNRANPAPSGPASMQPPSAPSGPRKDLPPKNHIKISLERTNPTSNSSRPLATPSSRSRHSTSRNSQPPTPETTSLPATPVDPYQAEREARMAERQQKEEQRRASLQTGGSVGGGNGAGRKRSLDDGAGVPTGPRGGAGGGSKRSRRVGYKYEDEVDGVRGEREREGGRY
ncbi:hypothetical protein EJ08DRAFT_681196 [Tothia fuscella]|uniref:RING-type domain-containing protein n=1 Tax=Tothia fuscella TaxID=1048955 RepID=A0A9P4NLM5_9PEZI|nr:hypothetical protein EJ08DRAFT_681196 [Tothia fuscella]